MSEQPYTPTPWRPGCHGKNVYSNRKSAWRACAATQRRSRDDRKINVYFCGHCNGFHWGHVDKREHHKKQWRRYWDD